MRITAIVLLFLGVILAVWSTAQGWTTGGGLSVDDIEREIHAWGAWGPVVSVAAMVIHSFVPFPAEFVAIANGMLYGPLWGSLLTWTGAMLGAMAAFGVGRWLGKPIVRRLVTQSQYQRIEAWSGRHGARALLTARLIPVIAFNLVNYGAALAAVSWRTYLWTTALGILPMTIAMAVFGNEILDFIRRY